MENIISREEQLADLIEAIMQDIEAAQPGIFTYGEVRLSAGMERFLYFRSVNDLKALRPLLKAGAGWRAKVPAHAELGRFYDDCTRSLGSRWSLFAILSPAVAMTYFLFKYVSAFLRWRGSDAEPAKTGSVAFVALNRRFVHFFRDIIAELGRTKCCFLPVAYESIESTVNELGVTMVQPCYTPLRLGRMNMGPFYGMWAIYLHVLERFLVMYGTIQRFSPSVLVFAEGTAMEDEVACQAAAALGVPTVKVQSGRASILDSGYRRASFYKTLCWGQGFAERFKKHSPQPRYVITGSPLQDQVMRDRLSGRTAGAQSINTLAVFTQPVSMHISRDEYAVLVEVVSHLLLTLPHLNIVVRKHPADHAAGFDILASKHARLRMMGPEQYALSQVLAQSQIALSFFSTTLSEAAAYGVIPVMLKLNPFHSAFPYPEKDGAALVAESYGQAIDLFDALLNKSDLVENTLRNISVFVDKYFGPCDGLALKRIVHHIQHPYLTQA